jgi:hypothetical protein
MTEVAEDTKPSELELLKERADMMGISYHPSIGLEKLREKVNAQLTPPAEKKTKPKSKAETIAERNSRLRREANRLVRIRVTCMNPNKKDWSGEIFAVANSVIGTVKKFVPFNVEAGYHVPWVIYEHMKNRKYQYFKKVRLPNGREKVESGLTNEFNIEVLKPLSPKELKDLADRQAMNHSID